MRTQTILPSLRFNCFVLRDFLGLGVQMLVLFIEPPAARVNFYLPVVMWPDSIIPSDSLSHRVFECAPLAFSLRISPTDVPIALSRQSASATVHELVSIVHTSAPAMILTPIEYSNSNSRFLLRSRLQCFIFANVIHSLHRKYFSCSQFVFLVHI